MPTTQSALEALSALPGLEVKRNVPLSQYTRFGIGGPAQILVDTPDEQTFLKALQIAKTSSIPFVVLGAGTNIIVSDSGFAGIVLRYSASGLSFHDGLIRTDAGAVLQALVDFSIAHSLSGLHTMTGIPGWVGAAIYGNAGAYGHSIMEFVEQVRFFDGAGVRYFSNAECEFAYRESIFKKHKEWLILSATLRLPSGNAAQLGAKAAEILETRNAKYPPDMKCAGSIFKNLILAELPDHVRALIPSNVIREGKVPSAWFLEQAGAKGMQMGGIHVATYHANLIYNAGAGTARELVTVIQLLKKKVFDQFQFELEEEVQYVGF